MSRHPRYPGYDVLAKRDTPSWDAITRRVIEQRLATPAEPRFLTRSEFAIAQALCRRILPQPDGELVPLGALLDAKLLADAGDGFREGDMPYMRDAWRRGLAAIDAEAEARHDGRGFAALDDDAQDDLLRAIERGERTVEAWGDMPPDRFFAKRVLVDVPGLFYGHPAAWSEIGFGGPANPRGYVRLGGERRDPWEAAEEEPGREPLALTENRHVV